MERKGERTVRGNDRNGRSNKQGNVLKRCVGKRRQEDRKTKVEIIGIVLRATWERKEYRRMTFRSDGKVID